MLTQAEAKAAIRQEWYVWPKETRDKFHVDGLLFFNMLKRDKPDLLRFKYHGSDEWQYVKGWIQDRGYGLNGG